MGNERFVTWHKRTGTSLSSRGRMLGLTVMLQKGWAAIAFSSEEHLEDGYD